MALVLELVEDWAFDLFGLSFCESATGTLNSHQIVWHDQYVVNVVMAANGYPGDYTADKGAPITGIEAANKIPGVLVFPAGVGRDENGLFVNGGRVLNVTAMADSLEAATANAYAAVDCIRCDHLRCRDDIGTGRP